MKRSHNILARILVLAACLVGAVFFFQQFDKLFTWKFFAALTAFLIFVGFAIVIIRKTR